LAIVPNRTVEADASKLVDDPGGALVTVKFATGA
jgi:hypothetical protein